MNPHFAHLESLLRSLLNDAEFEPVARHREDVQHFIEHREYGIALETIVDAYALENETPSDRVASLITALADAMDMDRAQLWRRLEPESGIKRSSEA